MAGKAKAARPNTTDAVDVAMDIVGNDDVARNLLEKHSRLIDQQIRSERLEHRNKLALIAFRSVLAAGALALMLGFGWMVINARSDRGLVIEALSVPPDLAQRGLTGEAIASNLADKLAVIDRTARSFRSPETMTVNWGNEVKIQIPETGVSIGEVDAFLRRTLGRQTTIGGAVFRTPQGLRLTVRAGGSGAVEQVGTDANLEAMIEKAAEGVFAQTQAYRYSKYLEFKGRTEEAMKVARELAAASDDPKERAWAWAQISNLLISVNSAAAIDAARRGIAEDPSNPLVYLNGGIAASHLRQSRLEAFLVQTANKLGSDPKSGLSEVGVNQSRLNKAFEPLTFQGDFRESVRQMEKLDGPLYGGFRVNADDLRADVAFALHDIRGSERAYRARSSAEGVKGFSQFNDLPNSQFSLAMETEEYPQAIASLNAMLAVIATNPETPYMSQVARERFVYPDLAVALAFDGQAARAQRVIAAVPADCDECVVNRAIVASLVGDHARARRLGAEAIRRGVSPLYTYVAIARMELRARQWPAALAAAGRAVAIGPNYADAHKYRGDALRRLGRHDEAVAAYRMAADLAPAWGRLRIDWGMAEGMRGDKAKARAQFDEAARRFLSNRDRRVLAVVRPLAAG